MKLRVVNEWKREAKELKLSVMNCLEDADALINDLCDEISGLEVKLEVAEHALAKAERLGESSEK